MRKSLGFYRHKKGEKRGKKTWKGTTRWGNPSGPTQCQLGSRSPIGKGSAPRSKKELTESIFSKIKYGGQRKVTRCSETLGNRPRFCRAPAGGEKGNRTAAQAGGEA